MFLNFSDAAVQVDGLAGWQDRLSEQLCGASLAVEPWGVVTVNRRWYLVGHDRLRGATRTLRRGKARPHQGRFPRGLLAVHLHDTPHVLLPLHEGPQDGQTTLIAQHRKLGRHQAQELIGYPP